MKKIIVVLLIILILCGGGYFTWSYLDENFRDYVPIAEESVSSDESIYFVGDYKKKDYKLNIKENGIYKETINITKDEYTIKNKEFKIINNAIDLSRFEFNEDVIVLHLSVMRESAIFYFLRLV